MPKYLIERDVPGIGKLSNRDLQAMSLKSNKVLRNLDADVTWQQSYVCDEKLYCIYIAPSKAVIREHAERGEFPITEIFEVKTLIDPSTGEEKT